MTAEIFLDANVLLYASSNATEDKAKRERAQALMIAAPFALSAQVLQEYIANALRKEQLGISEENIHAMLEIAATATVLPVSLELIIASVQIHRRFQVSHWDATIIAAAVELGCTTLYSEDLNYGQNYDGVRVVNPFLG
jgi:predicted nucleic acid-binding protein